MSQLSVDGLTSGQLYAYDNNYWFNNRTDAWEYDFSIGALPTDGSCPAPSSAYLRHTHTDYKTDTAYLADAVHLVSLPIAQKVMDGGDNLVTESDYTYDNAALVSASPIQHDDADFTTAYLTRGNVTGTSRSGPAGGSTTTSATYDIAGNVITAKDGNQNQTTYASASQGAFPVRITDALNQATQITWDYNAAKPIAVIDSNNNSTGYTHNTDDYIEGTDSHGFELIFSPYPVVRYLIGLFPT